MLNRKVAACIAALVTIAGIVISVVLFRRNNRNRRIAALENRMDEVESDTRAIVAVEQMRTVLPFPRDHLVSPQDQRARTRQP